MNWYVVYTKPKWEKKVAEKLLQAGIECYCPMVNIMKQWSDRKRIVQVPLFNSYVFVQLPETNRNLVFQVSGVVRYLFWLGKPAIVKDKEIQLIKENISKELVSEMEVIAYKKGDKIKLDTGFFAKQEAIIQEVSNTHCIMLLESLGCVLKMKWNK